jgi:hypothetical protein
MPSVLSRWTRHIAGPSRQATSAQRRSRPTPPRIAFCRETDGVGAGENGGRDLLRAHAMTLRINVAITRMARTTPYPSERDPMVKSRSKISRQPVKKSKKTAARTARGGSREKSRSAEAAARAAPSKCDDPSGFSQSPERPYLHYVVMPSPIRRSLPSCRYYAGSNLRSLKRCPRTIMAQVIRAILLASATAATLIGRRSMIRASQSRFVPSCRAYRVTAIAPATSHRKYQIALL